MYLILSVFLSFIGLVLGENGIGESCPCGTNQSLAYVVGIDRECLCRCIRLDPSCKPCPPSLQRCADTCCFAEGVLCDDTDTCRSPDNLDFVTAAKIAVLFALTVTCLAALVALFRAFVLPLCRPRTAHLRTASNTDTRSLNSVQRFVLERLTSRPPPYDYTPDKPPTYDECLAAGIAVDSSLPPYESPTQSPADTSFTGISTQTCTQENSQSGRASQNENETSCYAIANNEPYDSPPVYSESRNAPTSLRNTSSSSSASASSEQGTCAVEEVERSSEHASSMPESLILTPVLLPSTSSNHSIISAESSQEDHAQAKLAVAPKSGWSVFCVSGIDNRAFKLDE